MLTKCDLVSDEWNSRCYLTQSMFWWLRGVSPKISPSAAPTQHCTPAAQNHQRLTDRFARLFFCWSAPLTAFAQITGQRDAAIGFDQHFAPDTAAAQAPNFQRQPTRPRRTVERSNASLRSPTNTSARDGTLLICRSFGPLATAKR